MNSSIFLIAGLLGGLVLGQILPLTNWMASFFLMMQKFAYSMSVKFETLKKRFGR